MTKSTSKRIAAAGLALAAIVCVAPTISGQYEGGGRKAAGGQAQQAKPAPQAKPAAQGQNVPKPWLPENQGPTSERTYKVHLDFNRWHDVAELIADMKTLEKAYPKFLKYQSIGKTYDGRDIPLMTINNPDSGAETSKAAMYIPALLISAPVSGLLIVINGMSRPS